MLNCTNTTNHLLTRHFILYARVYLSGRHFFDLVGHPQALQEDRSKICLVLLHCGIPNAYKFLLQEHTVHKLVYIELVV